MKLHTLLGLIALSCFAGSARAQSGAVTIHINNPGWVISQNTPGSGSQFISLPGSGTDFLNVNAFVDIGIAAVNRAQSNVQGVRTGATPLSASASASASGSLVFIFNGPGTGSATASAVITPTGVLPAQQSIAMSGNSSMTLTCGSFGFPNQPSTTSTASVVPPSCSGKICSVYNRKILTQGSPINQAFATNAFFVSQQGSASANCTLHVGDTAFENTDVLTDATVNLN